MFKYLKKSISSNKAEYFIFIIIVFLSWIISIIMPILNGILIDLLIEGQFSNELRNTIILMALFNILGLIGGYIVNVSYYKLSNKLMNYIIKISLNKLYAAKMLQVMTYKTGYLSQRLLTDSKSVANFNLTTLKEVWLKILTLIVSSIILITINLKIGNLVLALAPIYILLHKYFKKKLYEANLKYKEAENNYFENLNFNIESLNFLKINVLNKFYNKKFDDNFKMMHESLLKSSSISILFSRVGSLVTILANLLIITVGIFEIFNGRMSIGEFTVISTYFNIIIGSIEYLMSYYSNYQATLVSVNRISEIINREEEISGELKLKDVDEIIFQDVNFTLDNKRFIFKNFNYNFEKGKIYKILGENGSGKSSVLNLFAGLYNGLYTGGIYVNNYELKELDIHHFRERFVSFIEQELTIINGSLFENIAFDKSYSKEEIKDKIKVFELSYLDNNGDNIFNKEFTRKAFDLSGGEKQKINIIRNLIKEPKLLMLDEADSALDVRSCEILKEELLKIKEDKIILIVSHAKIFDEIIDETITIEKNIN